MANKELQNPLFRKVNVSISVPLYLANSLNDMARIQRRTKASIGHAILHDAVVKYYYDMGYAKLAQHVIDMRLSMESQK